MRTGLKTSATKHRQRLCSFYQRARMSILSDAGIAAEYFRLEIRAIYAETATA